MKEPSPWDMTRDRLVKSSRASSCSGCTRKVFPVGVFFPTFRQHCGIHLSATALFRCEEHWRAVYLRKKSRRTRLREQDLRAESVLRIETSAGKKRSHGGRVAVVDEAPVQGGSMTFMTGWWTTRSGKGAAAMSRGLRS